MKKKAQHIPDSIEREGIDNYLNRTAFDHGGVDWMQFDGFVERGVNKSNLMRCMNLKTRDTINKYLKLREEHNKRQAAKQVAAMKQLNSVQ